jgi:hypothetical protein
MESKISNFEWGMVIGLFVCIDLTQFFLDWTGIGEFINPVIDPAIGISLWFYFWMRGVDMKDGKRMLSMVCTFIGESIPVIDALPLWTMDVLIIFFSIKAEKTLKKLAETDSPADDKQKKVQKQQESDNPSVIPEKNESESDATEKENRIQKQRTADNFADNTETANQNTDDSNNVPVKKQIDNTEEENDSSVVPRKGV